MKLDTYKKKRLREFKEEFEYILIEGRTNNGYVDVSRFKQFLSDTIDQVEQLHHEYLAEVGGLSLTDPHKYENIGVTAGGNTLIKEKKIVIKPKNYERTKHT